MDEGMGKRLRLRFSRVLPSFHSKPRPAAAAAAEPPPPPPAFCLSPVNPKTRDIDFPPLRLAPVVSSRCCRPSRRRSAANPTPSRPVYTWRHDDDAVADDSSPRLKIDSDDSSFFFPSPPVAASRRRESKKVKKAKPKPPAARSRSRLRVSSSSADSGWFSSEEWEVGGGGDDETETLLSSFETDSSDVAGGKVAESFAVVKRSEDPRGDFRRSMAEMVLEKRIYDAAGLEQLLRCFLSLNSRHHHPAIVAAFSDVWAAVFPARHRGKY